ncbi:zinc-binding alcohol dehydrogenase family protein [Rheinheimera pacifica]|uniref:zinc-binding alcohol dehydrogenase family protein n=1 Tax=Rheinheimera pacifica TaxID=173990 RepID=UPI002ED8207F
MKAVGFSTYLPADHQDALVAFDTPKPTPGPRDLLVAVKAVSINPVDTKVRRNGVPESGHRILGYDASGVVEAVGAEVTLFQPGDEVFYAGDISRPGTNAEFHLVDERIVGPKPKSLSFEEAASLPLTSITAWELLFDSFKIPEGGGEGESLLVVGGAGGVGSALIQLAKRLTKLHVIATASRPETQQWCLDMGADDVIDHNRPLKEQLVQLGKTPKYAAAITRSDLHFERLVELLPARGQIAMIDDPGVLDIAKMKLKSLSFHWEFMFTRSMFQTEDMIKQHELLKRVSELVDAGELTPTVSEVLGPMSAASIRKGHQLLEAGNTIGKVVLSGF